MEEVNNGNKGLPINGEWCDDPDRIKIIIKDHFESRFVAQ